MASCGKYVPGSVAGVLTALGLLVQPALAEDVMYRIAGEVNAANYRTFAEFVSKADPYVALKISIPDGTGDGLVAKETDGVAVEKDGVKLAISSGYRAAYEKFYVEGYYKVERSGDGITLTPARSMDVEASGKPVKLIAVDKLPVAN